MPSSSVAFRAICGTFYWTFQNFMARKAQRKAALRYRTVSVSGPVAVILVFLVGFLLRCGDVEANPGPPKRQTLLTCQGNQDNQSPGGEANAVSEPTIADVFKMLNVMDKKMDSMKATMQEQMDKIQSDFTAVMKENRELKEKVTQLEDKLDDLEGRSRRKNLIFHGIPHPQGRSETWADCEKAVKSMLKDEMGIEEEIEVERAHRLKGGKAPHPIIVCFNKYKDKERILFERRTLKENKSRVYISEDFTPRVRDVRRKLLPFLKEAKQAGKKAFLRFDSLVVEGKTHAYDAATQRPVERRGQK